MEFRPGLYCVFPLAGSTTDIVYGDVSGNGDVTVQDAILLLRYTVGLINIFPVEYAGGADNIEFARAKIADDL